MNQKKKLMVVIGAGASIELCMPCVDDIDKLFCKWSLERYKLSKGGNQSLYSYIRDKINRYYSHNPKPALARNTNYEEILYVILQLSAMLSDNNHNMPTNAFLSVKKLPDITSSNGEKRVDGDDLRELYYFLVDNLVSEFRDRCKAVKTKKKVEFEQFKTFICQLCADYDVAFVTLNHDNLITQVYSNLFTGFSATTGSFDASSIYNRKKWGLIYHLHGSVHFDMQGDLFDIHSIKWNTDINSTFKSNSSGRNSQETVEGLHLPTSVIVTGYAKTSQIQRVPFRTYYAQLDKIAELSDAVLFLGYGFNDFHINNFFHSIRKNPKPVVIVDWANDNQEPMQFRSDVWSYNLGKTIPFNAPEMATKQHHFAPDIVELKNNEEFEVSKNPDYPLSIWYGGFISACNNYDKIKSKID